ncbi:MAG: hypothetical protein ACOYNI_12385 [Acidimicrobiia bacterium]
MRCTDPLRAGAMDQTIALHQREQLSFWDALIVVAAQRIGATVVYSEDLGDRAAINGIEFVNPFAEFEAV